MLNLGNIERPKKMALSTEEINKINGLYGELDVLKQENSTLRDQLSTREDNLNNRFDKLEELVKELAGAREK